MTAKPPQRPVPESRGPAWRTPTPPHLAIEIASGRITVAQLAFSGGAPVVAAFASEPIADEAVAPALVGTNIPKPAEVIEALRRVLQRAGLGAARRAALIVPDGVARVSLLPFEQVPPKPGELDQLIRWQLRKSTPFPLEEARVTHLLAHADEGGSTFAAVVARRDVLDEYEHVVAALGVHAGIVDLASFNVVNAVIGAGAAPADDWLLISLAAEGTTLAILRGADLMFYRHRASMDGEPLSALVHQTAMYHEDRLGGSRFGRVYLCGAARMIGADRARAEISERLAVAAQNVDIRGAAGLRDSAAAADVLDALAAPVGVLLRDRAA
jgi:Tfp pilus assembly PilM family ATPase